MCCHKCKNRRTDICSDCKHQPITGSFPDRLMLLTHIKAKQLRDNKFEEIEPIDKTCLECIHRCVCINKNLSHKMIIDARYLYPVMADNCEHYKENIS